jgi:hypothetical protein
MDIAWGVMTLALAGVTITTARAFIAVAIVITAKTSVKVINKAMGEDNRLKQTSTKETAPEGV